MNDLNRQSFPRDLRKSAKPPTPSRSRLGYIAFCLVQSLSPSRDRKGADKSANYASSSFPHARILLVVLVPALALAQDKPVKPAAQWMDITLEQIENGAVRTIDPGLVLKSGDLIRFRVRNNFDGYLYVINYGTSGVRSLLFPREETGRQNRVVAGKEYSVPSTGASFQVAGPAGHDIVYWLISPVALTGDPLASMAHDPGAPAAPTLLPRCDDSIFRARALCIDSSAGPRNVPGGEPLPDVISSIPRMTRRELLIVREKESARVSVPGALTGPVVYEFRVAHR